MITNIIRVNIDDVPARDRMTKDRCRLKLNGYFTAYLFFQFIFFAIIDIITIKFTLDNIARSRDTQVYGNPSILNLFPYHGSRMPIDIFG